MNIILDIIVISGIFLNAVMLDIIRLNVVAPIDAAKIKERKAFRWAWTDFIKHFFVNFYFTVVS